MTASLPARSSATTRANNAGGVSARAASCTSTNSRVARAARVRPAPNRCVRRLRRPRSHVVRTGAPDRPATDRDKFRRHDRRPRGRPLRMSGALRPRDRAWSAHPSSTNALGSSRPDALPDLRPEPMRRPDHCDRSLAVFGVLHAARLRTRLREPRRECSRPCRRRCPRRARARRPESDEPWRACASHLRKVRGPAHDATGHERLRRPC